MSVAHSKEPASIQSSRTKPVRVGFLMHAMKVAGAEVLVERLIADLTETIEPTIFCLDEIGAIGERLQSQGVSVHLLNRRPGIDWQLPSRLAAKVASERIEVLHAHQYTPFFYAAMARLKNGLSSKIVFTEHGRHYPDVVSFRRRATNRWLLQRAADEVNACCEFSAHALRLQDGFSNVSVVRNGVDPDRFFPVESESEKQSLRNELRIDNDKFTVICVARFHPIKDHVTLIRAWKLVCDQTADGQLLLVGDGSERDSLEQLVDSLGLQDHVRFLGVRNDIRELYCAADVFAMASLCEASSLTLLEAMACGCPPIVTDVGGNPEHVTDGQDGMLVPRQDAQSMAEAMLKLQGISIRNQLGRAARERVCREFSITDTVNAYRNIYERLSPAALKTS